MSALESDPATNYTGCYLRLFHSIFREMIASLKICAAVHGTVDDNMAVHATGNESSGEQDGEDGERHDLDNGTLRRCVLTGPISHACSCDQAEQLPFLPFFIASLLQVPSSLHTKCPRKWASFTSSRGKSISPVSTHLVTPTGTEAAIMTRSCSPNPVRPSFRSHSRLQLVKSDCNGNRGAHRGQPRTLSAQICQEDGSRRRVLQQAVQA